MAENESERLEEMTSSEMEEGIPAENETEGSASVEESKTEETAAEAHADDADPQDAAEAESSEDVSSLNDSDVETVDEVDVETAAEVIEEPQDEAEEESVSESDVTGPDVDQESDRYWFVVHCYSGYENKVRHNLEQRIETMGMKSKIFDVVVPTEEEIEIKDGKRKTVERRVFPGYILVQMIMDEDSWYVVRNTPGVTGFVGMGNEPTPLRPEEVSQIVKRMEAEAPRIKVTYKTGQKVRIIDGPFNDFIGTVSEIDMDRAKVRVMVSFFGRETPVELDFLQVEKA